MIILSITTRVTSQKVYKSQFRYISNIGKERFSKKLNFLNWQDYLSSQDVNSNCSLFINKIKDLFDESFPIKTKYIYQRRD